MAQKTVTSKKYVEPVADELVAILESQRIDFAIETLVNELLKHKVKFPLLEFIAEQLFERSPVVRQSEFMDLLARHDYQGTSVIVGKILGLSVLTNISRSFSRARKYIIKWDSWYSCDHTSERVFGTGILVSLEKAVPLLEKNICHNNAWIRRSVGIGIHYAAKRGIDDRAAMLLADMILPRVLAKEIAEQRGIGWALKTISRNHPKLMTKKLSQISRTPGAGNWAIKKIETGLTYSK